MADNLIGGIDKYLSKSKKYIKKRIVSIFDATGEIADLVGDYYVACADIFDVFSGDDAKGITADIIQVFSDGFLGATDLAAKFARDFISFLQHLLHKMWIRLSLHWKICCPGGESSLTQ